MRKGRESKYKMVWRKDKRRGYPNISEEKRIRRE